MLANPSLLNEGCTFLNACSKSEILMKANSSNSSADKGSLRHSSICSLMISGISCLLWSIILFILSLIILFVAHRRALSTRVTKSAPTNPDVNLAISCRSNKPSNLKLEVRIDRISFLADSSGSQMLISRSNLLLKAGSRASGLFVAPITITLSALD
ncbi:hypothetical protein V8G54_032377 [Vigna mungo]|uniref:Uncharacterized protein n=1 Tax=Vigna mungo TaxID=3915 RepID=A0AAQ3MMC0_VIGMU